MHSSRAERERRQKIREAEEALRAAAEAEILVLELGARGFALATGTPQGQARFFISCFLTSNVVVADLPRAALSRDLSRSSLTVTVGSPNGSIRFTLQNLCFQRRGITQSDEMRQFRGQGSSCSVEPSAWHFLWCKTSAERNR